MTERDGAWMARILARFTPEMVEALGRMGEVLGPAQDRLPDAACCRAGSTRSSSGT